MDGVPVPGLPIRLVNCHGGRLQRCDKGKGDVEVGDNEEMWNPRQ